jgi:hypothetical protein
MGNRLNLDWLRLSIQRSLGDAIPLEGAVATTWDLVAIAPICEYMLRTAFGKRLNRE